MDLVVNADHKLKMTEIKMIDKYLYFTKRVKPKKKVAEYKDDGNTSYKRSIF